MLQRTRAQAFRGLPAAGPASESSSRDRGRGVLLAETAMPEVWRRNCSRPLRHVIGLRRARTLPGVEPFLKVFAVIPDSAAQFEKRRATTINAQFGQKRDAEAG